MDWLLTRDLIYPRFLLQDRLLDELYVKESEQVSKIHILSVPMSVCAPQAAMEFPIYFHWILGQLPKREGEENHQVPLGMTVEKS